METEIIAYRTVPNRTAQWKRAIMAHQGCLFDQKYSNIVTYCNLKYFFCILNIFQNVVHSCDGKATFFSSHYFSLQCHMILHKSFLYADLVLKIKKKFFFLQLMTIVLLYTFVETDVFFFLLF